MNLMAYLNPDSPPLECWCLSSARFALSRVVILQRDGVFQCVSQDFFIFPIFRGTTLKGETTESRECGAVRAAPGGCANCPRCRCGRVRTGGTISRRLLRSIRPPDSRQRVRSRAAAGRTKTLAAPRVVVPHQRAGPVRVRTLRNASQHFDGDGFPDEFQVFGDSGSFGSARQSSCHEPTR